MSFSPFLRHWPAFRFRAFDFHVIIRFRLRYYFNLRRQTFCRWLLLITAHAIRHAISYFRHDALHFTCWLLLMPAVFAPIH